MGKKAVIKGILPGSIADQAQIVPGDCLLRINGQVVSDIIDYRYHSGEDRLTLEVMKANGDTWVIDVEKDFDEDLGLDLEPDFGGLRRCANRCLFCFVDQMPKGCRRTLYEKDDDYRQSFLNGNFITMTNLQERDLRRILSLHLSPLYVSVHTTNPDLRCRMMGSVYAGDVLEKLQRLVAGGIFINAQVVLCPGLNDHDELDRTLKELASLWPGVSSIAVVPVGLTSHREKLFPLQEIDSQGANRVLDQIAGHQERFLQKLGSRLVFPADEFFVLAGRDVPEAKEYEGFPQEENGVGLIRLFLNEMEEAKESIPSSLALPRQVLVATGVAAAGFVGGACREIAGRIKGLQPRLIKVTNSFFGSRVNVAGLVVGKDLVEAILKETSFDPGVQVLVPGVMIRDSRFLDDMTLEEASKLTGREFLVVPPTGAGLVAGLTGLPLHSGGVF